MGSSLAVDCRFTRNVMRAGGAIARKTATIDTLCLPTYQQRSNNNNIIIIMSTTTTNNRRYYGGQQQCCRYYGSSCVVSIVFLEITPLIIVNNDNNNYNNNYDNNDNNNNNDNNDNKSKQAPIMSSSVLLPISNFSCKYYLQRQTLRCLSSSKNKRRSKNNNNNNNDAAFVKIEWIDDNNNNNNIDVPKTTTTTNATTDSTYKNNNGESTSTSTTTTTTMDTTTTTTTTNNNNILLSCGYLYSSEGTTTTTKMIIKDNNSKDNDDQNNTNTNNNNLTSTFLLRRAKFISSSSSSSKNDDIQQQQQQQQRPSSNNSSSNNSNSSFPIYFFPSDNPIDFDIKQPCCVKAYSTHNNHNNNSNNNSNNIILHHDVNNNDVLIDDSCLIRILPPALAVTTTTTTTTAHIDTDTTTNYDDDDVDVDVDHQQKKEEEEREKKKVMTSLSLSQEATASVKNASPLLLSQQLLGGFFEQQLSGEIIGNDEIFLSPTSTNSSKLGKEVLRNHNPETIQELTLLLKRQLLSSNIHIGTTQNAFQIQHQLNIRKSKLRTCIRTYYYDRGGDVRRKNRIPIIKQRHDRSGLPSSFGVGKHRHHNNVNNINDNNNTKEQPHFLIVHSPNHGEGKTILIQTIAQSVIGCNNKVHLIRPGYLFAKYGINADTALETILHSIVMSSAAAAASASSNASAASGNNNSTSNSNPSSVCIILDQLDAMFPSRLSGRSSIGDSAEPVLIAIASYLRKLSISLQQNKEFPFPIKNKLYGGGCGSGIRSGGGGIVLKVNLCLVGIITCPDDGWKSMINELGSSSSSGGGGIFDILVATRYRIPTTTGKTRLDAFLKSFNDNHIHLDKISMQRLPILAHSFHSARGSTFDKVAKTILLNRHRHHHHHNARSATSSSTSSKNENKNINNDDGNKTNIVINVDELERAIETVKNEHADVTKNDFGVSTVGESSSSPSSSSPSSSVGDGDEEGGLFGAVGGAVTAKIALEDALALSKEKRILLARFGMSPPTGILLYGPPGCGKTLLAKAVARLLKRTSSSSSSSDQNNNNNPTTQSTLGGSFLSISSSDIVSSEIGTSEKVLLSAFEFADKNAPAVIFFDEFQALFTERSRGGSGRLASTLLQCMDDVKRWWECSGGGGDENNKDDADVNDQSSSPAAAAAATGPRVVILGATNTPWMVDPAFLRPGRFDRVVYVDLPDEAERKSIMMVHLRNMKIEKNRNNIGTESSLTALAERIASLTTGFSGADLAALCRAAALRALLDGDSADTVSEANFIGALEEDVHPSSDDNLIQRLREWKP